MGWGWDTMGLDGMGWDEDMLGLGWDGTQWGWDGMGWDGRDGAPQGCWRAVSELPGGAAL